MLVQRQSLDNEDYVCQSIHKVELEVEVDTNLQLIVLILHGHVYHMVERGRNKTSIFFNNKISSRLEKSFLHHTFFFVVLYYYLTHNNTPNFILNKFPFYVCTFTMLFP